MSEGGIQQHVDEAPTQVITLRITPTLHRRLLKAAHQAESSMNRFCVESLTRQVDRLGIVVEPVGSKTERAASRIPQKEKPAASAVPLISEPSRPW